MWEEILTSDKWTGNFIAECNEMFLHINYANNHWLSCIIDFIHDKVSICDTLPAAKRKTKIKELVTTVLDCLHQILMVVDGEKYQMMECIKNLAITYPEWVLTQSNGVDCGTFV